MQFIDPAEGTFTKQELARLAVYRAAVAAGFYTDWDGTGDHTDAEVLAALGAAEAEAAAGGYPFTEAEREHLEQCRDAFEAGGYADDRPPAAAATAATEDS
jgi:hypothetical protein